MTAIMRKFNLGKAIAFASGKEVKIAGGLGLSKEDPILITENHHGLAVELARFVAKEAAVFYGLWNAEIGQVSLIDFERKNIDEFTILYDSDNGNRQEAKLYFDISPAYSNVGKTLQEVKTKEELELIYKDGYHKEIDSVPHFYATVHWALNREEGDPEDVWKFLWMLGIEDENLAQELSESLRECGL